LLALCGACGLGREQTPEERAAAAEREAAEAAAAEAGRANAVPRARRVPGLAALIDPNAPVPRQDCPATLPVPEVAFGLIVPTASYASLESTQGEDAEWRFLDGWGGGALSMTHGVTDEWARLRADGATNVSADVLASLGGHDTRLLVVFVHSNRTPTQARGAGFSAGSWSGGLYVLDVDADAVLCSAPFQTRGEEPLLIGDDPRADWDDVLQSSFELDAMSALDSISSSRIQMDVHRLL